MAGTDNSSEVLGYNIFTGDPDVFSKGFTRVICTINPHSYVLAEKDKDFRDALMSSDILLPDGVGFVIAAKILNGLKIKRITGSDIHRILIEYLDSKKGSCFYLGSGPVTLEKIKERLAKEHPSVRAGFYSPPFTPAFTEEENHAMIKAVNDSNPEILFVGMTAPRQEKWVRANRDLLNARLICPVGAVFDFYAGTVKRPGKFWLKTGLEWLPRLLREPRRLWYRTFISAPLFIFTVFLHKLRKALGSAG